MKEIEEEEKNKIVLNRESDKKILDKRLFIKASKARRN
jgi:hypothetical protein